METTMKNFAILVSVGALALGTAAADSNVTDFGEECVGGYPYVEVTGVKKPSRIRVVYATHPDGLKGNRGDFWHETRANYMGWSVWLPILPANTDRWDWFDVTSNGVYRAAQAQGLVRYARWSLDHGDVESVKIGFENRGIHSEEPVVGAFKCSDDRLTRLWRASVRTCQLAAIPARDKPIAIHGGRTNAVLGTTYAYLSDGAKRDRLVWSGDLWWAQRNMYVAFDVKSPYMPGSLRMLAENRTPEGYVQACPYPESHGPLKAGDYGPFASDEFAAWFIPVLADHVLHTGDLALGRELFPAVRDLVAYLVHHSGNDLVFEQRIETCKHSCGLAVGGTSCHHRSYMNVLLWKAYRDAAALAEWLGEEKLRARWSSLADQLAKSVRAKFWNQKEGGFILSLEEPGKRGIEADAMALAARFATAAEAERILPLLKRHGHGKFQLLAVRGAFEYDRAAKAMELIAAHNWYAMLSPNWKGPRLTSECMGLITRGWGDEAHPDTSMAGVLTDYVLGVEPVKPGYREFKVCPRVGGGVTNASGKVSTPYGMIEVEWRLEGGKPRVKVSAPKECQQLGVKKAKAKKTAKRRFPELARQTCAALESGHISLVAPNDVISQRAWTNLLESVDSDHMFFHAADIAEFERSRLSLDDALRQGDVSFARRVNELYRERLRERVAFATNFLAAGKFECPPDASYRFDRKGLPWPREGEERDALWRLRLCSEVLEETLNRELEPADREQGEKPPAATVANDYLDLLKADKPLSSSGLAADFLNAIVSSYDPHSLYMTKTEYSGFKDEMAVSLCGVGAELEFKRGGAVVKRVIPGGPLAKDGHVHAGDRIVGVAHNGGNKIEPLAGLPDGDIVKLLRGEKGSKVTLEVVQTGGVKRRYTLVRDNIQTESGSASSRVIEVDDGKARRRLGYLRLPAFYADEDMSKLPQDRKACAVDVRAELLKLRDRKVEGVALDLRGNPGGSLDDAIKIIGFFVRGGTSVTLKNSLHEVDLPVAEGTTVCEVPLVVLITSGSASASELVSGTLKDEGRAVIVGDAHTFGKGTAQEPIEYRSERDGALILTKDMFYLAGGASTQAKGVGSHILLPSIPSELFEGEAEMPYALAWDCVPRPNFRPAWDLPKFVPELASASARRLKDNADWRRHQAFVEDGRKMFKRKEVPMSRELRLAQMKRDQEVTDEMERIGELIDGGGKKAGKDVVLDEGLHILADLVRLNGGRPLPKLGSASVSGLLDDLDD